MALTDEYVCVVMEHGNTESSLVKLVMVVIVVTVGVSHHNPRKKRVSMKMTVRLYDDSIMDLEEAAVDSMGITYQNENKLILPGEEDVMHMVLIPWASISELQYSVTPDMVTQQAEATNDGGLPIAGPVPNRKQRRAHLQ